MLRRNKLSEQMRGFITGADETTLHKMLDRLKAIDGNYRRMKDATLLQKLMDVTMFHHTSELFEFAIGCDCDELWYVVARSIDPIEHEARSLLNAMRGKLTKDVVRKLIEIDGMYISGLSSDLWDEDMLVDAVVGNPDVIGSWVHEDGHKQIESILKRNDALRNKIIEKNPHAYLRFKHLHVSDATKLSLTIAIDAIVKKDAELTNEEFREMMKRLSDCVDQKTRRAVLASINGFLKENAHA